jgi:transposase
MIGFNSHQKFYIYTQKVDMRKGVYGLCGIIRNELDEEPTNGSVYVFFAKSLRTVKLLVWDKDGFVIYGKWLSKGKYEDMKSIMISKKHSISYEHLIMILSGVSLLGVKQRPRYKMS